MRVLDTIGEAVGTTVDDVRHFLTSEEGRRARSTVASTLITLAPVIAALPPVRASKIGRLVGFTGGAALIVKVAEVIRDWEPQRAQSAWQE